MTKRDTYYKYNFYQVNNKMEKRDDFLILLY